MPPLHAESVNAAEPGYGAFDFAALLISLLFFRYSTVLIFGAEVHLQCSSQHPCSECAAHNRECIFDENADKRRKVYTKMTRDQLEYYRGFLERLVQSIRSADPQQLETLIGVIRQESSSYDDIAVIVSEILGDSDNQSAAMPDYV